MVISDKDFLEQDVFHTKFPAASVILSLFYVMRSFRREVTCDKLDLLSGEREVKTLRIIVGNALKLI